MKFYNQRMHTKIYEIDEEKKLTAAIDGFLLSPAGGCVTSAPRNITGSLKTFGLQTRA